MFGFLKKFVRAAVLTDKTWLKKVSEFGGFHLLDPSVEQLEGTIEYMKSLGPRSVHACHCTDLNSKIALSRVVDLKEVGVGITLNY